MALVVETDIGRDADDLFALAYFIGIGTPIRAICISPGDHDQVAVARAILRFCNVSVPVLTPRDRVVKSSTTPFHRWLIHKLGSRDEVEEPDGHEESLPKEPVEVFICGPAKMSHLLNPTRVTMQGGFVPYSYHQPKNALEKFVGKEFCPTFNLGGTQASVQDIIINAPVPHLWVGKNICHSIVYTPQIHLGCPMDGPTPLILHKLAVEKYLEDKGAKLFHDPLAAILHSHPELGKWMPLKPLKVKGGFTAIPSESCHQSLVDLVTEPWFDYFKGLCAEGRR